MFLMPAGFMCIACHENITGEIAPNEIHTADEIGSCEHCHQGHYSEHGKLLKKGTNDLCLGCHDELQKSLTEKSRHTALEDGECTVCHNPHFKKGGPYLVRNQPDLCFGCHPEINDRIKLDYRHAAVEDNDCTSCHNPHIQFSGSDIFDLCSGCHDIDDPGFQQSHLNMKTRNCVGCHDPHGSSSEKLFNPVLHSPFEDGDCNSCHATGMNKAELVSRKICLNCHDEPASEGAHSSEKVAQKNCVDCHSPHASKSRFLLK